ncbi:MAG: TRAP transporter large permease [Deltaproteobacteria bacterium]|nr:TRAP transporter large permease [Deltaproteobacteria bacterium]
MVLTLVVAFVGLLLLGLPISYVLAGAGLAAVLVQGKLNLTIVAGKMFEGLDSFPLMAIPFFMLAGALMNEGGITRRLIHFAQVTVGWVAGGLGYVNVVASMLFAGISGSAAAEASAIGSVMIPAMKKEGYHEDFSAALTAAASTMGPIIPPSIPMILYGIIANVSIGALFLAGAVPGFLLAAGFMGLVWLFARRRGYPAGRLAPPREIVGAFKDALLALTMPGIILGGILGGVFTPTESSAVAAVYALVLGLFVYREIRWARLPALLAEAGIGTAIVMLVIGASELFGWILAAEQVPMRLAQGILSVTTQPWLVLLLVNLLLFVLGIWLEPAPLLIVLVPVLAPLAAKVGIDPVHFGTIVVINAVIGLVTPPVGASLFVVCSVGRISLEKISRAVWPFVGVAIAVLLLVTYVPALSTWLPRLLM